MRILQINNSMPTKQSNPTFKSKDRPLSELFIEAVGLFEEEYGAMERALERPARSIDEALQRFPFPPEELERQESQALTSIERNAALERSANFAKYQENEGAVQRGQKSPLTAFIEDMQRYFSTQQKYELLADQAIRRIHAPRVVGKFSDKVVELFKTILDKSTEALLGGSKDPDDVRAFAAAKSFLNSNAALLRTDRNHNLSMEAISKFIQIKVARPDLNLRFDQLG